MKHKRLFILIMLLIGVATICFSIPNSVKIDGLTGAPNEDHVAVGDLSGSVTTTYTAEAWINATQLTGGDVDHTTYGYTVFSSSTVIGGYPLWLTAKGSELNVWSYTNTASVAHTTSGAGLTTGTWYHVAITSIKGAVNGTKVYVNGSLKLTYTNENQGTWNNVFTIGVLRSSRTNSLIPFHGLIDEVRVWNVVRSQAEIQADMYHEILTPLPSGLKGYWQFNETTGLNAPDLASPAHTGTLTNGASWNSPTGGAPFTTNPSTQASNIVLSDIGNTSLTASWTNGNGAKRIVLMNTVNSFTDPVNGTDPSANAVWQNAGQQVVYNGVGSSVPVTGLSQLTSYWFRVYEYNGAGVTTVYMISTAANNPIEGDQTLPVELSSFTAILTSDFFVRLHWITQSETEVRGFYIYRGTANDVGSAVKVSPLIEASNTSGQHSYEFIDTELTNPGTYYYWLNVQDLDGGESYHGPTTVYYDNDASHGAPGIPLVSGFSSIYPNPFNPSTTIAYGLNKNADVSFIIYNSRGQIVRNISEGQKAAGNWKLTWDGLDDNGNTSSTGVYYIKMNAGKDSFIKKAVLLK